MRDLAKTRGPNNTGWQDRHKDAVREPDRREHGLVQMLKGWQQHAEEHKRCYQSPIGDDGVLGPEWRTIGCGLRALLNDETGRLDCGTIDGWLLEVAAEHNVELTR